MENNDDGAKRQEVTVTCKAVSMCPVMFVSMVSYITVLLHLVSTIVTEETGTSELQD